jgi:hypothetical protein
MATRSSRVHSTRISDSTTRRSAGPRYRGQDREAAMSVYTVQFPSGSTCHTDVKAGPIEEAVYRRKARTSPRVKGSPQTP